MIKIEFDRKLGRYSYPFVASPPSKNALDILRNGQNRQTTITTQPSSALMRAFTLGTNQSIPQTPSQIQVALREAQRLLSDQAGINDYHHKL